MTTTGNPPATVSERSRHRSYSQLSQIRRCGWQYFLERVEGKPQRPSCPAVAGRVIHQATEIVDFLIDGYAEPPIPRASLQAGADVAAADSLRNEIESNSEHYPPAEWRRFGRPTADKPNGEDIDWFERVGIPLAIGAYIDWRLDNPQWVLFDVPGFGPAIEVPFEWRLENDTVRGFIDRIFVHRDTAVTLLTDIKSGQKPKTDEQLGTYSAALRAVLPGDFRWGAYLYGLKHGVAKMTTPIDLSHHTDSRLAGQYAQASWLIDNGIFIPQPGESCWSCSVNDWCEYARAAI